MCFPTSEGGLRRAEYGTHSLRWNKPAMIYHATGNIRTIRILLGHRNIEKTVRYLGLISRTPCSSQSGPRSEAGAVVQRPWTTAWSARSALSSAEIGTFLPDNCQKPRNRIAAACYAARCPGND
jgi:hypothetical protein